MIERPVKDKVSTYEARRTGHENSFIIEINFDFTHGLIPPEKIASVDLFFYVIENRIISVSDNASAHFFELLDIVYYLAAEESTAVF